MPDGLSRLYLSPHFDDVVLSCGESLAEAIDARAKSLQRAVAGTIRFSGNVTTMRIYGAPIKVISTFVFHFVLFGVIAQRMGLGQFFIDIAQIVAGRYAGGPAKVMEKMPVPGMGWSALLRDPDGNVFGLFQEDTEAK